VTRNVLSGELKYFLSNARESTTVETLLWVAFSRWKIQRLFEDSKMELGLDPFEVRKYASISRHLLLGCVSHLFLAEFRMEQGCGDDSEDDSGGGGEKSAADDQPVGDGDQQAGAAVGVGWPLFIPLGTEDRGATDEDAAAQRPSSPQPPPADDPTITRHWNQTERPATLSLAEGVAL